MGLIVKKHCTKSNTKHSSQEDKMDAIEASNQSRTVSVAGAIDGMFRENGEVEI